MRRAIITGAARGIGAAIARRLSGDGHDVTALVRTRHTLEPLPPDVRVVEGDLVEMDRERFLAENGPFDILVNNAALYPAAPLETLDPEEFRRILEVNLVAAVDLMSLAGRHMAEASWGRIVNIGSITATAAWPGWADRVAYASSKGGLEAATRIAARALGRSSVTVNCVAPGAIPTAAEPEGSDDGAVLRLQALPFRGSVDDIAATVSFLVSDDARFITGQTITVDGGWTMS